MRQAELVSLKERVLQREKKLLWEKAVCTQFKAPLNVAFNQYNTSQTV